MANKLYEEASVEAIAQAIRTKNGLSTTYKIGEMAAAILAIPAGSGTNYLPTVLNDGAGYTLPSGALTGVTKIRAYAFYGANVSSIVFPSGLLTIEECAFQGADLSGADIDIPASVTSIEADAFQGTTGRTFIFRSTTPATLGSHAIAANYTEIAQTTIYVPDEAVATYKSAWSALALQIHGISEHP